MLNKKEQDLIQAEFAKNMRDSRRARGDLLPEEKGLLRNDEWPGPGYHKHTPDNPFGLHRHLKGDDTDGAHVHSPQNPGGEHAHGSQEGQALATGRHFHYGDGGLGYHDHEDGNDDTVNRGIIPVQKPGLKLPVTPGQPAKED
ncbi:MAG: hypothetical protein ACXABY_02260 [Candidatus Thorarchaeota archaeon]|jgi:hypothetical protein